MATKRKYNMTGLTEVCTHDLRALLFWANTAVRNSVAGSYGDEIEHILESYAEAIGFKFDRPPVFGGDRVKRRSSSSTESPK